MVKKKNDKSAITVITPIADAGMRRRIGAAAAMTTTPKGYAERQALRKAATDYAAACLLGRADAIEQAFGNLEKAAADHTLQRLTERS